MIIRIHYLIVYSRENEFEAIMAKHTGEPEKNFYYCHNSLRKITFTSAAGILAQFRADLNHPHYIEGEKPGVTTVGRCNYLGTLVNLAWLPVMFTSISSEPLHYLM